jgi:hypothetical protein
MSVSDGWNLPTCYGLTDEQCAAYFNARSEGLRQKHIDQFGGLLPARYDHDSSIFEGFIFFALLIYAGFKWG